MFGTVLYAVTRGSFFDNQRDPYFSQFKAIRFLWIVGGDQNTYVAKSFRRSYDWPTEEMGWTSATQPSPLPGTVPEGQKVQACSTDMTAEASPLTTVPRGHLTHSALATPVEVFMTLV